MFFTKKSKPRYSSVTGCDARTVMQHYSPYSQIEHTQGILVGTESIMDCEEDRRVYTLTYYSTMDGMHAQAFCQYNPHDPSRPNAGYPYAKCHCADNGNICLGDEKHSGEVERSAYTLEEAILKARYWCTAFSYMVEHGNFPQPQEN